jgi:hypothetical protein
MFSSGPSTPTLGSALVSGGLEDRARVHSLLQSLAATAAAAGTNPLDAASTHRGRGGRRQDKRKRSSRSASSTSSSSCKVEPQAEEPPHKKSKRQTTTTKDSLDKSSRASRRSRSQEQSPQPSTPPSPGSTSTPQPERPSSATRGRPVTRRGASNRATSRNKEQVEERVHQEGSGADEQHPRYHQLPPASFEVEWTEGVESPAHTETSSPPCGCAVLLRGEHHTSSSTTATSPTSSSTSSANEDAWEELLGELYYHFGTRREDLVHDGRGAPSSSVRRRLRMDDWSSSLLPPDDRHHQHNITSQGYLLHW